MDTLHVSKVTPRVLKNRTVKVVPARIRLGTHRMTYSKFLRGLDAVYESHYIANFPKGYWHNQYLAWIDGDLDQVSTEALAALAWCKQQGYSE